MTVIVYRDGVMAADSGSFGGSAIYPAVRKLARGPDGTLFGITGRLTEASAFLAWVDAGCQGDYPKPRIVDDAAGKSSFQVLRVRPGHSPEAIDAFGIEPFTDAPYATLGHAEDPALGALHAGASAAQAVDAAIAHSQYAAGPVRTISHT